MHNGACITSSNGGANMPQNIPPDDWNKIIPIISSTAVGGAAIGAFRSVIYRKYGGFWQWFALMSATVLVSVLVGLAVADTSLSHSQQAAVIGVCAFLAEDILLGLGALAGMFARDPLSTLRRFWDAIRGKGGDKP
jgi:hypothetical protein